MGPYRGVGRPGGCFAMERIIDEVAHELRMDPIETRRRNLIPESAMPYVTATGLHYDSGNYRAAVDEADRRVREQWTHPAQPGKRAGIGYAMLVEQAGHRSVEWFRRSEERRVGKE